MYYQFIKKSRNDKIGKIPATNSPRSTCPPNCPLKDGPCYAETGYYTRMNWDKLDAGERGSDWRSFVNTIKDLPAHTLWRHNVSGDLVGRDDRIDSEALDQLVWANKGKRGFTYTHYPLNAHNKMLIKSANNHGFTVNVSTNNLSEAVKAPPSMPVVTLVSATEHGDDWRTLDLKPRRVVRCPAEYRDDVTCKSCKLCSVADRDVIVGFTPHGTKRKQADIIAVSQS